MNGAMIGPTIRELVTRSHSVAKEKGWYELWPDGQTKDHAVNVPEKLALIHSEVSEALEVFREFGIRRRCSNCSGTGSVDHGNACSAGCTGGFLETYILPGNDTLKPEGFVVELADVVIRVADLCGALGLDLAGAIEAKHQFNTSRPFRHGGKQC